MYSSTTVLDDRAERAMAKYETKRCHGEMDERTNAEIPWYRRGGSQAAAGEHQKNTRVAVVFSTFFAVYSCLSLTTSSHQEGVQEFTQKIRDS